MSKTIGIIATLDTKGYEAEYIKKQIEKKGHSAIIIDPGVLGQPLTEADISREKIAKEGGKSLKELIELAKKGADRADATKVMIRGAKNIVKKLYSAGKLHGVISLGGSTGMSIGTAIMKALPIGVPKLMVCTFISSKFIGEEDITMMQTPADILGLNRVMKKTYAQAAGSIVGMVEADISDFEVTKPLIGVTALGVTTPAVMKIKSFLEEKGYEIIVFHIKTEILDKLVEDGVINGVIDLTPAELVKTYISKILPDRTDRLESVNKKGLPQVIVPGGLDMITLRGTEEDVPTEFRNRKLSKHGPFITLARTSIAENKRLGKIIAERANRAKGPVVIAIPLKGFSSVDKQGQAFYNPEAITAFTEAVKNNVKGEINVIEIDAHINDEEFAKRIVDIFIKIMERRDN